MQKRMKNRKKQLGILLLTAAFAMVPARTVQAKQAQGIQVNYHTKKEVQAFARQADVDANRTLSYEVKPSWTAPYKAGELSSKTKKDALAAVNAVRYIAGIDANVTLNEAYGRKCQAAVLVNAANGRLAHYPDKPAGMASSLYDLGCEGASSSNLAWASWETGLEYSLLYQWMADGDESNKELVAHRRWVLNPVLGQTGFGGVTAGGTYTSMYALDKSNAQAADKYYGVAWPAQTMPVELFSDDSPWSISMNRMIDASRVKVTLTRERDGKKWSFSEKSADGVFHVDNSRYGQPGCIVFRSEELANTGYRSGDIFSVEITGLDEKVAYQVEFFSLQDEINDEPEKITDIKLEKTSYVQNGKVCTPKVVVKDAAGTVLDASNYEVTYDSGRKKIGKYRVTVKMKGDYTGEKTLTFQIVPKKGKIKEITAAKKGFELTYSQVKNSQMCEIVYSTDKNFPKTKVSRKTVRGGEKVQIKNLKPNTKYYVRIRTYKKVDYYGKTIKITSAWSAVKSVTTK